MDTDKALHNLGNLPSPAEILAADYPEWHFWRERDSNGRHGDWVAEHANEPDRVHRAPGIHALRTQLEKDAARRSARRGASATRHKAESPAPDRGREEPRK